MIVELTELGQFEIGAMVTLRADWALRHPSADTDNSRWPAIRRVFILGKPSDTVVIVGYTDEVSPDDDPFSVGGRMYCESLPAFTPCEPLTPM